MRLGDGSQRAAYGQPDYLLMRRPLPGTVWLTQEL